MKNWMNRWLRRREKKASSVAPLFAVAGSHIPIWTPRQYDTLAEEGYQKNIIVYRCVSLIARGVASVPWQLYQGEARLSTHPLLSLLQNPNPQQVLSRFMEALTAYLLLAGNVYIEAVMQEHELFELYLLRPDRVRIIPSVSGIPEAYEYTLGGRSVCIPVNPFDGKSRVRHIRTFHPLHDWYGMSPIEARYHLWEDTILPHLEMIKGELNQWLVPFFGENLSLDYDTDSIPALAPKREALWGKIEKASFLTLNEKRELVGYPPLPEGNRCQ